MTIKRSSLIFGYHGLDEKVGLDIILGKQKLKHSHNEYDWLGHGAYFWESSFKRAEKWAQDQSQRRNSSVKSPFVIGAVIDLGECLDLLDQEWLDYLEEMYQLFLIDMKKQGKPLPKNKEWSSNDIDFKNRELDCAVIRYTIEVSKQAGLLFDSVRAAFWEGEELYPNAGFKKHNHIQIAVINDANIKAFFLPRNSV